MEKHFTVTTYIFREKLILLLWHPKFQKWMAPGGHLEPNETPPECALREAKEETGLDIHIVSYEKLKIQTQNATSIETPYLSILEHVPMQGTTPAHQHIDLIYCAYPIGGKELEENMREQTLKWFSQDELQALEAGKEIFIDTLEIAQHLLQELPVLIG